MITQETSLREALALATQTLEAAGVEEPRREARLLLMAGLTLDLTALVLRETQPIGEAAPALAAMLARRAAREPLSRILKVREFFGLDLTLGPDTLDPRPDTEVLVEAALEALADTPAPRLLDLGTGTGAILLALLHARPDATGLGIDIALGAVDVARGNAAALGLAPRARFEVGDLFAPVAGEPPFHAILSNPPYIPAADLATLDPEVRLYDPARALDGGPDGLDFYRAITSAAPAHLAPGGLLGFEVGKGQAEAVAALMAAAGFAGIARHADLAGIARVVLGRKAG
jgi:release factor glutamine methyltransferase